jgi:quercetin dioxygenase-like cupin family protein
LVLIKPEESLMSLPESTEGTRACFRPAGGLQPLTMNSGARTRFTAPGSVTNGQFGLFEWELSGPGKGPAPHYHKTFSESFYVLTGKVGFFDGNAWVTGGPGDFLYVPVRGVHAFRNDSDDPAKMLIHFAPGPPREKYFEALAEVGQHGRTLSYDEWTDLFARHDQYRAE